SAILSALGALPAASWGGRASFDRFSRTSYAFLRTPQAWRAMTHILQGRTADNETHLLIPRLLARLGGDPGKRYLPEPAHSCTTCSLCTRQRKEADLAARGAAGTRGASARSPDALERGAARASRGLRRACRRTTPDIQPVPVAAFAERAVERLPTFLLVWLPVDQRGRRAGVTVDVDRVAVDADLEQQSLEEGDAEPAEVVGLEHRVELAALLGGAGQALEAGAQAFDAGADGGVE